MNDFRPPLHLARLLALASIAVLTPALAEAPPNYAWQWPLANAEGMVQVELTPEVYARIQRSDLGDLAAINADNQMLPIGPLRQLWQPESYTLPPLRSVPWFHVSDADGRADNSGDLISLHISRDADGRLRSLDTDIAPGTKPTEPARTMLVDLSFLQIPVDALQLEFSRGDNADFNAQVQIDGSDDLAHWHAVGSNQTLLRLNQGGFSLQRDRLSFPPTSDAYLRVRVVDGDPLPALGGISAQPRPPRAHPEPERRSLSLSGVTQNDDPGSFVYRSSGPFPVQQVNVVPASGNQISSVHVDSRDGNGPWTERAQFIVYRLQRDGQELTHAPVHLSVGSSDGIRDRQWRVRTSPALDAPPMLQLDYLPDRFVLMSRGPAPYRLVAGSTTTVRPHYPLGEMLAQLRNGDVSAWRPPAASIGAGSTLLGEAALSIPPPPLPVGRIVLWVVLAGGAILLLVLMMRLMREPPPESGESS